MKLLIHADDYGCTRGVTDNILACADDGVLNSVSVLANGLAFDYAMDEYRKRPGLRLSVHLNLVEREPILPAEEVEALVNKQGLFRYGFVSLWMAYLRADGATRERMRREVRVELTAQIRKVQEAAGPDYRVELDSHCHVHMVPFVFEEILRIAEDIPIEYVRIPQEQFFLCVDGAWALDRYCGSGLIKHHLLNGLSRRHRAALGARGIAACDDFVGVLCTGNMTERAVRAALSRLPRTQSSERIVELLFHPGGAANGEASTWDAYPGLQKVYCSPWRAREQRALQSDELRALLEGKVATP
jgi:YdjC-like protein